jgi:hypothetical protein
MADLGKLLCKLNIVEGKCGNNSVFLDELKVTDVTIFQKLDNRGIFMVCIKQLQGKSLNIIKSKDEILQYLDLDGEPN